MNSDRDNFSQFPPAGFKGARRFAAKRSVEKSLAPYQVASAMAYVQVLVQDGAIKDDIAQVLLNALKQIADELLQGQPFLVDSDSSIYAGLLRRVGEITGGASQRLTTGRSEEEWLAVDVRLWVRRSILSALSHIVEIRKHLINYAERYEEDFKPAYAHMQPKRREFLSFFFLANESRLQKDFHRFKQVLEEVNLLPSGLDSQILLEKSANRQHLAELLNFDGVTQNSFDSTFEFDHLVDFASASAVLGVHLSQMASELLLWSTQEFGFLRLPRSFTLSTADPDSFSNPRSSEVLELLRSRGSSFSSRLTELLNNLKGLPLSISQETNEVLNVIRDVIDDLELTLTLTRSILPALILDTKKMAQAADLDSANRVNAVDYLIEKGFEPDKAVSIVDSLIEYCRKRKRSLSDLAPGEWQEFSPAFETDIYKYVASDGTRTANELRYDIFHSGMAHARQLLAIDAQHVNALSEKIKLAVEVNTSSE